jgi:hypothetical protein
VTARFHPHDKGTNLDTKFCLSYVVICATHTAGERRASASSGNQCTRSTSGSLQVLSKKDFSGP